MIKMTVVIEMALKDANEFGVGVRVEGILPSVHSVPDAEGATMVGIGMAINAYMRSRGARNFNCLKQLGIDAP